MQLQYLLMQVAVPAPGRVFASCPPIRFSFVDCATGAGFPRGLRFDWLSPTKKRRFQQRWVVSKGFESSANKGSRPFVCPKKE